MSNKQRTSPRPLSEVDKDTRDNIERILSLDPHELAKADRIFMRARRDYLTPEQIEDYATVEEDDEEANNNVEDTYDKWSLEDLKAECVARGLEVTGRAKAPYIEALEKDDEEAG